MKRPKSNKCVVYMTYEEVCLFVCAVFNGTSAQKRRGGLFIHFKNLKHIHLKYNQLGYKNKNTSLVATHTGPT